MHYYKRNLGDYAKKTGRLTMLQHGAYTLLIDSCYDREKFPTLEQAIEWTWASTEAEIEAVKFVLSRFFTLGQDGEYVQERILAELLDYHSKADKNKTIAIEREAKRRENRTKRAQAVDESPPNHKPITNNHKPSNTATRGSRLPANWVPNKELAEWSKAERPDLDLRKVLEEFRDYWTSVAGSKGVKLDWDATWRNWVRKQTAPKQSFAQQAADVARTTVPPPPNQDAALKQIIADREKCAPPPAHIREMMKGILGVKNA